MRERTRTPGSPGPFLAVRLGLPLGLAALGLACAALHHASLGWWLLLSVACLAEVSQVFQGTSHLKHRATSVRRDGLWVKALRPLTRVLGCEDAWIRSYLAWNNAQVEKAFAAQRAQKALVLLPHCIQIARCRAELTEDLNSCHQCGLCPVGEVLKASLAQRWEVRVFNRSHKAARHAKSHKPDLMLAVSCADRLLKGVQKLPETPCFAIPLDLPKGMCVDTRFDTALLEEAMERLVRPRNEHPTNIQPLRTDEIA